MDDDRATPPGREMAAGLSNLHDHAAAGRPVEEGFTVHTVSLRGCLVDAIRSTGALKFGKFTLRSGRESDFYLDLRLLTFSDHVSLVAHLIRLTVLKESPGCDAIGGPALGAVPIVGACLGLSYRPLRGFAVREAEKDHGLAGLVAGDLRPDDDVVAVDDVTTTGGSLLRAIDAVEAAGAHVVHAVTIVDRTGEVGPILEARGIRFTSLLTLAELGIGPDGRRIKS
jgi:orotate phosphoribosyltransferase